MSAGEPSADLQVNEASSGFQRCWCLCREKATLHVEHFFKVKRDNIPPHLRDAFWNLRTLIQVLYHSLRNSEDCSQHQPECTLMVEKHGISIKDFCIYMKFDKEMSRGYAVDGPNGDPGPLRKISNGVKDAFTMDFEKLEKPYKPNTVFWHLERAVPEEKNDLIGETTSSDHSGEFIADPNFGAPIAFENMRIRIQVDWHTRP